MLYLCIYIINDTYMEVTLRSQIDGLPPLPPRSLIFFEKKSDAPALIRTPNFIYFLLRKFLIFAKL